MEEDFIKELGVLGFVTRLKRISDVMIHDGRRLYKELGMDIEPNWFVIFRLLENYGEMTVTEIAERIGFAHPSVISIVNKMIKAGYLEEKKCGLDKRKRLLNLTQKANKQMPEFEEIWLAGTAGLKRMLTDLDALNFLDKIETRVFEKGFKQRALEELSRPNKIEIINFDDKYSKEFANLNYEWIKELFRVEAHDREMLDNPREYIINDGGQIFFALLGEKVVGTVALISVGEESFELAKMAVSAAQRGLKIGDKLMSACLKYAKELGKKRVFLLSNTKLIPAINLYKKFGFREIPLDPNTLYERTDIQMEITFN